MSRVRIIVHIREFHHRSQPYYLDLHYNEANVLVGNTPHECWIERKQQKPVEAPMLL